MPRLIAKQCGSLLRLIAPHAIYWCTAGGSFTPASLSTVVIGLKNFPRAQSLTGPTSAVEKLAKLRRTQLALLARRSTGQVAIESRSGVMSNLLFRLQATPRYWQTTAKKLNKIPVEKAKNLTTTAPKVLNPLGGSVFLQYHPIRSQKLIPVS